MEFDNLDSRPGKSCNFGPGPGKSWNLMLANLYALLQQGSHGGHDECGRPTGFPLSVTLSGVCCRVDITSPSIKRN